MPKPSFFPDQAQLISDIRETLLAGLKQWRPDLSYPMSHSDMEGCIIALLISYDVKRRPIPQALKLPCPDCRGLGTFYQRADIGITCHRCSGKGWLPYGLS